MIDPEAVHHSRVEVAHMHRVFHDVVREIIGLSVFEAALHAAAGHPHCEAAPVVIAPRAWVAKSALAIRGTAELRREDHECVFEHAARLEVLEHCRRRLVDVAALVWQLTIDRDVLIPSAMKELHETNAALKKPPPEQAVRRIRTRAVHLRAVHLERLWLLARQIRQLRHARLHAKRHLVRVDAREGLGVAHVTRVHRVQLRKVVKHRASCCRVDAVRVREVRHRISARTEPHALVRTRQKAASPKSREDRLAGVLARALRHEHDEGGQIRVLTPKAVTRP